MKKHVDERVSSNRLAPGDTLGVVRAVPQNLAVSGLQTASRRSQKWVITPNTLLEARHARDTDLPPHLAGRLLRNRFSLVISL